MGIACGHLDANIFFEKKSNNRDVEYEARVSLSFQRIFSSKDTVTQ